ncbi:sugar phosphate isomerase/epimerase family protein [Algoriphagus terrigena]|uniref:sugar phosphate isomerase/epimerase family protein n=1 Tax=Algoriphagus terrigena TaxID=344884 RepID=UPI0003FCBA43|nr:sugar phosphate isomerase/epimerase family protein [Algoriphagus terrigena]
MIRSAVTINLVDTMSSGPWIYWHDLEGSLRKAAELGFDGVELFTRSGNDLDIEHLRQRLDHYGLLVAAVGTGAGKVLHGLTLTDPDPEIRKKAISFISDMISFGAKFGAPAIIGSMQGSFGLGTGPRLEHGFQHFCEGLDILGEQAKEEGVFLLVEPLNRYETSGFNYVFAFDNFQPYLKTRNVKVLADLFHMNIEEENLAQAVLDYGKHIGHVHFADSNRRPMGLGHTDMTPIAEALKEIGYSGYVSAEAFPYPNPEAAAEQTIREFRKYFR